MSVSVILDSNGRAIAKPPLRANGRSSGQKAPRSTLGFTHFYEGSFPGRQRGAGNFLHVPQDYAVEGELERQYLAFYARQLSRNCGEVDGIIRKLITYVVGREMTPMSISKKGKDDYEQYWKEWGREVTPDGASIGEVQALCLKKCILDGDVGIWRFLGEDGRPQLQVVSSQKIGNCYVRKLRGSREQGGVEYRALDGKIIRYWLNRAHWQPGSVETAGQYKPIAVTPDRFSLMYVRPDTGAYRGISHLAPVINDGLDISNIWDALKIGVVSREMFSIILQRQSGGFYPNELAPPLNSDNYNGPAVQVEEEQNAMLGRAEIQADDPRYMIMGPGTIFATKEGEELKDLTTNRPRAEVLESIDKMVRRICTSMGLPYEFAVDPGQIKGTGTRAILRDSEETFKFYACLLDRHLNKRMWRSVIWHGILSKEIPLEPDWDCVEFTSPQAPSVDVAKDVKAELEELAAGTKTMKEIYHAKGKNWIDGVKQRVLEEDLLLTESNKLAKKHGFPLESVRNSLSSIGELESESTLKQEEKGQNANIGGGKKNGE